MKRNPSKHRSKANPSSGSSIEKELMVAFAWAKIDSEERKDFKGKDLDALFAHAKEKISVQLYGLQCPRRVCGSGPGRD